MIFKFDFYRFLPPTWVPQPQVKPSKIKLFLHLGRYKRSKSPKGVPRHPQTRFKRAQEGQNEAIKRPKKAPSPIPIGPRTPQDLPKSRERGPRSAQDFPKATQWCPTMPNPTKHSQIKRHLRKSCKTKEPLSKMCKTSSKKLSKIAWGKIA